MLDSWYFLTTLLFSVHYGALEAFICLEVLFFGSQTLPGTQRCDISFPFIATFLALDELNVIWISQPMRYKVGFI